MAGHSHSKNVAIQKGKSDAKRAKIFNKLAREISVSCKQGMPDPKANPRLRAAIIEARANNMPRDRIERAIKAAQPGSADNANYEEVRYEGYGPGGCALIVEALTDNRNRTAAELRTAFSKMGGNLGETGSVAFMFERVGEIIYPAKVASADDMLATVIEADGEDVESETEHHFIYTSLENFGTMRIALEAKYGEPESAKLIWEPKTPTPIEGEALESLRKLLDTLEDNDDVQNVFGNYELPTEA